MKHPRRRSRRLVAAAALVLTVISGAALVRGSAQAPTAPSAAGVPDEIDFNWHIRPILSENCFQCHGPDVKNNRADMRLDTPEGAYAERGGPTRPRHPIVPGDPDASEVLRRVTASNAALRMPPQSTHKTLTPDQIALLREWIRRGAQYKPHWAFITPTRQVPPPVDASSSARVRNEIDRFVLARLQREGLFYSPDADRATLINRVSLTLTGLPPTLAEVDAFASDTRPDAYTRLLDRLLSSPGYGEHMAAYWMNLARWADTDGFLDDHHDRLLWPWRDWVIRAFNSNMPFDRFSTWQLAGDLLPNATTDQKLATAFLRLGPRTTENGAIDEEYRVEYTVDRANTVGTAFLGMTVGCARCHDHKYDVISHKDFYSMAAFFNNADEPGYYPPGHSTVQAGPTLLWPDKAMAAKLTAAESVVRKQEALADAVRAGARRHATARGDALMQRSTQELMAMLRASVEAATEAHYPLEEFAPVPDALLPTPRPERQPPANLLSPTRRGTGFEPPTPAVGVGGDAPGGNRGRPRGNPLFAMGVIAGGYVRDKMAMTAAAAPGTPQAYVQEPILRPGIKGNGLFFNETNKGFLGKDVGFYERTQPFSLDFWFFVGQDYKFHPNEMLGATGKGLPYGVPLLQHRDTDAAGGSGYRLQLEDGHLWVYLAHSRPANMIALRVLQPLPVKEWTHITVTYDGSSRAAGTRVYLNGAPAAVEVDHDTLTRSILPFGGGGGAGENPPGVAVGSRFREKAPVGSGIDEIRLFKRALSDLEVAFLQADAAPTPALSVATEAVVDYLVATDPEVAQAAAALSDAREAQNKLVMVVPQVLVMRDAPKPRQAYLLNRGIYSERGEPVDPRGIERIFPWDSTLPQNRLGLARWLFDPRHPLTARVFVNRIWQMHFGQGLVETSENFGTQGSVPSHPELLDWLTVGFIESGWDVKRLHRTILVSGAYRQQSAGSDLLQERDPRNVLLTRGPRYRMPAELVRDHALAASGLLKQRIGGPSVYPYQPDGVWNPGITVHRYPTPDAIPADDHHRRSVYTFIKRNALNPQLQLFDFPDRNLSSVRRQISNTPLQALQLLNDPQFVEAYRALATHAMKSSATPDGQLTMLVRLATRRLPDAEELSILRDYYRSEERRYTAAPAEAQRVLRIGVTPPDAGLDAGRLAAMTGAAALIMNSPDAYTVR